MTLLEAIKIVGCSFFASIGFGIVFQIEKKNLWLAGLGGAVTRVVLILMSLAIDHKFLICFVAAMVAGLYAEIVGHMTNRHSTVYLYPAIIPLIPGDLLYYTFHGVVMENHDYALENGLLLIYALLGLGIGFVMVSLCMHYHRKYLYKKSAEGAEMRDL